MGSEEGFCYLTQFCNLPSSVRTLTETSLLLGSVKNCCPLNWVHFQSSCYFFSTNTMTWTASLKNCSSMGAHLVVINTQEEQVVGVQLPPVPMKHPSQDTSLFPYMCTVFGPQLLFVKWIYWNTCCSYHFCKSIPTLLSLLVSFLVSLETRKKGTSMFSSLISKAGKKRVGTSF